MDKVVDKTKEIEAVAKRKEQMIKIADQEAITNRDTIQQTFEVNDMYIDSVQAKLKLLEQI